jgi:hypothetical protein
MGIVKMLSVLLALAMIFAQTPAQMASGVKEDPAVTALALKIYGQMRAGKVDEALLTPGMNKQLAPSVLAMQKPVLDQLGTPVKLALESSEATADGVRWVYLATFATAQLHVTIYVMKDGKVGGYALAL